VVTLAALEAVLVLAALRPHDASSVQVGDAVDIRIPSDNDSLGSGVIETISQVVDPERQTVPIRARARNPQHHLRPNAFVEVHISSGSRAGQSVLQVPTQCVVSDGLETVAFRQVGPGHYRRTEVTVGRQSSRVTEIRAGLKPGDRVVSRGALLLRNALDVEG
jgi:cobalt-zinc-cadmium efflux system membrane fusion protein